MLLRHRPRTRPPTLYPDLKTLPPRDLQLRPCRPDGHATAALTGVHNVLRFTNTVWNDGEGDLDHPRATSTRTTQTGPATQRVYDSAGDLTEYPAGDFTWHAGNHNHYHYEDWGQYQLWTAHGLRRLASPGGRAAPAEETGVKTTAASSTRSSSRTMPGTRPWQTYGFAGCDPTHEPDDLLEGMSVGWGDTYDYWRVDQWIVSARTATLADGDYVLRSVTDPDNKIYESPNKADPRREAAENNDAIPRFTRPGRRRSSTPTRPPASVIARRPRGLDAPTPPSRSR